MSKANYIVFIGAILLTGCATSNVAPLDDAYYWPDKNTETTTVVSTQATQTTTSSVVKQAEGSNSKTTSNSVGIEYTSVQDTAVTIRIKR